MSHRNNIRMTNIGTVFGAASGTRVFGPTSTTQDVLAGIDLQGKRILVTGVSAGLGVETARSLAAHGAQVVGAAKGLEKGRSGDCIGAQGKCGQRSRLRNN